MLVINHLFFSYPKRPLFKDLSLSLASQEIVSLCGPSGSGKTTLLKLIAGILKPQAGTIEVESKIAYMGQDDQLLPWYTLHQNLTLFANMAKVDLHEMPNLLELMGLKGFEGAYPHELSKGMRQRGALLRALLLKTSLLLLDEPFSNLDVKIKEELHALLLRLQQERKLSILLITHDFNDAIALSDRVLLLKDHHISHEWNCSPSMTLEEKETLKNVIRTNL